MHRSRAPADVAPSEAVKGQAALVDVLRNPALYEGVKQVTVLETHISKEAASLLTGWYRLHRM